MAIFGIGANYGGDDVSNEFINNTVACVGWDITDAPALHEILRFLKLGDIIYIKSAPIGQGIRVKGIGIVQDNTLKPIPNLGTGVSVNWIWTGHENLGTIDDKYNVRNNTLYEEFNREVQERVLKLLFSRIIARP
jgi:hypothetical protein